MQRGARIEHLDRGGDTQRRVKIKARRQGQTFSDRVRLLYLDYLKNVRGSWISLWPVLTRHRGSGSGVSALLYSLLALTDPNGTPSLLGSCWRHVSSGLAGRGGVSPARISQFQMEHKRHFLEMSGDIVGKVDPIFFSDPHTTAIKALGLA